MLNSYTIARITDDKSAGNVPTFAQSGQAKFAESLFSNQLVVIFPHVDRLRDFMMQL